MKTCSILLADDHPAVCRGVRSLLATHPKWKVCGEAHTGEEAVEMTKTLNPDMVVMDLSMPRMGGLEAARQIRVWSPKTNILVLSMHYAEPMWRAALQAGVRGYVLKSDIGDQLIEAVKTVSAGRLFFSAGISRDIAELASTDDGSQHVLTIRQLELLRLLAQGMTNNEIAGALGISTRTVESHRHAIMDRLKLHSFSELVLYAVREHIIEPDEDLNLR